MSLDDLGIDLRRSVEAGRPIGAVANIKAKYLREVPGTGLRQLRTMITVHEELETGVLVGVAGPRTYSNQKIFSAQEIRQYVKGWLGEIPENPEAYTLYGQPVEAFYDRENSLQGVLFLQHTPIEAPRRGDMNRRDRLYRG